MVERLNRRQALGFLATVSAGGGMAVAGGAMAGEAGTMNLVDPMIVRQLAPSGRLRAAINVGNVVLAQRGGARGVTGPSVDIADALGRQLGVPVDFVVYEAAGLVVSSLANDHWDLAFMAIDPARADQIAFTAPYVFIEGTYMVRVDAPFHGVAELDRPGVRIAVGKGAAYDLYLSRALKQATLVRSSTSAAAIEQFKSDGLEAAAGVRQALQEAARSAPGYRVLDDSFNRIDQAVAVPRGRDEGLRYVSAFIEQLKASGFVRAALDRAGQSSVPIAPPAQP